MVTFIFTKVMVVLVWNLYFYSSAIFGHWLHHCMSEQLLSWNKKSFCLFNWQVSTAIMKTVHIIIPLFHVPCQLWSSGLAPWVNTILELVTSVVSLKFTWHSGEIFFCFSMLHLMFERRTGAFTVQHVWKNTCIM